MRENFFDIARDAAALYDDLDPYGVWDAKDYDETVDEFLDRVSMTVGPAEVRDELDEMEKWTEDQPEYQARIRALKDRLKTFEEATA